MINEHFCRIKSALSNDKLEVKCNLGFYTETSNFLEETKELGRSRHPGCKKIVFELCFFRKISTIAHISNKNAKRIDFTYAFRKSWMIFLQKTIF